MYFPELVRRKNYKTKSDGKNYITYSTYYEEIAEDCQHRCVYCDVLIAELGGESMHLDHFRPQKHFLHLASDPTNLVLACPYCNQLKSDLWPEKDGTSENGVNGFVDPFGCRLLDYFQVEDGGALLPLQPPAQYIIGILALNRPTRKQIRRARLIKARAMGLLDQVQSEIINLAVANEAEIRQRLPVLSDALARIRDMLHTVL